MIYAHKHPTPIGELLLAVNDAGDLLLLEFPDTTRPNRWLQKNPDVTWNPERLLPVTDQLDAYFAGKRTAFDVHCTPEGTAFQRRVWAELLRVPYGVTISYGELARRIGNPAAVRAVGLANGANPIAVIIPCHRVIGADGSLTGYGGGLPRKRFLLNLEKSTGITPPLFEL